MCILTSLAFAVWLGFSVPQPEMLKPPRPVRQTIMAPQVLHPYYEQDPYSRMRIVSRDRYGYLRPRVILGPDGGFYPHSGKPYPFTPIKGIP